MASRKVLSLSSAGFSTLSWVINTVGECWNTVATVTACTRPAVSSAAVVAKGAVRLTGRHQLHDVDLRAAHFNFDIETGVLIQPGGTGW